MTILHLSISAMAAAPNVTSVSPNTGTAAGGQRVTLNGLNFKTPNVTSVTVAGAAVAFTIIDDTKIDLTMPAHAAGAVVVQATNADGSGSSGYTYTTNNTSIQVTVRVTIPHYPEIQWGNGTTVDDAGVDHTVAAQRITPYTWVIKDSFSGTNLEVGSTYLSSDSTNQKTLIVENVSRTNAVERIDATASDTQKWSVNATPGIDKFQVQAQLAASGFKTLDDVNPITLYANLTKGAVNAQPLVLSFGMPTQTAAINVGSQQTCVVSLVATAN